MRTRKKGSLQVVHGDGDTQLADEYGAFPMTIDATLGPRGSAEPEVSYAVDELTRALPAAAGFHCRRDTTKATSMMVIFSSGPQPFSRRCTSGDPRKVGALRARVWPRDLGAAVRAREDGLYRVTARVVDDDARRRPSDPMRRACSGRPTAAARSLTVRGHPFRRRGSRSAADALGRRVSPRIPAS